METLNMLKPITPTEALALLGPQTGEYLTIGYSYCSSAMNASAITASPVASATKSFRALNDQ
jgi:hypothetical protein